MAVFFFFVVVVGWRWLFCWEHERRGASRQGALARFSSHDPILRLGSLGMNSLLCFFLVPLA